MLKGQDVILMLALLDDPADWTVRALAEPLGFDPATVHRSLNRLGEVGLLNVPARRVNRAAAEEFLLHGFKFVFPVKQRGESIGLPTAWAAPPLRDMLAGPKDSPPVWPDPLGETRGVALEPLHPKVPEIARRHPKLHETLALLDALRLGDARIRSLASEEISRRVLTSRPVAPTA